MAKAKDKKDKKETKVVSSALQETLKNINKKYGAGTISTGSKAVAVKLKRISTGSFTLDCETGGGYPEGRITLIAGPFSSGKSFLAYKGISEAQKKYPDKIAIFIDQEGTFDAEWAANFGIDLERLEVVRPATAEQAWDILVALIQSPEISIVVLDSLAAMASIKLLEKAADESMAMGGNAKMNNENLAKIQGILNLGSIEEEKEQPAIIIINQLRSSMDKYKPEFMPGGRGQEFYSSITIWVRTGDKYLEKRAGREEPIYVGHEIKFKTEKNKTFAPKRSGKFDIYVENSEKGFKAGEIDRLKEVIGYAIYWKVIQKGGSWFTILGNPEWKFQGANGVLEFLRDNEEVRTEVEKQVMEIALTTKKADITAEIEEVEEEGFLDEETGYNIDPETGEILPGWAANDLVEVEENE